MFSVTILLPVILEYCRRNATTGSGRSDPRTFNLQHLQRPSTPWRQILRSVPVWTLAAAYFANDWGYYTLASCIPLFMYDVLGYSMTNNGLVSAVPFLATGIMIPCGLLSDCPRAPGRMSTNVVRKMFCVVGFLSAGCMLILTGYTGCDRALAVTMMFIAISCICVSFLVVIVNPLDLAPLHAGRIMGLTQVVGSVASIAAPHAVGILTYHNSPRSGW